MSVEIFFFFFMVLCHDRMAMVPHYEVKAPSFTFWQSGVKVAVRNRAVEKIIADFVGLPTQKETYNLLS